MQYFIRILIIIESIYFNKNILIIWNKSLNLKITNQFYQIYIRMQAID